MVRNKWSWPLIAALSLVVALGAASCGGGGNDNNSASGTTTSSSDHSDVLAALISDIGKFNDRSFNQSQLEGLNRAKSELGVQTDPAAVEPGERLHPEPDQRCPQERGHHHLGGLPARGRDGEGREEVP